MDEAPGTDGEPRSERQLADALGDHDPATRVTCVHAAGRIPPCPRMRLQRAEGSPAQSVGLIEIQKAGRCQRRGAGTPGPKGGRRFRELPHPARRDTSPGGATLAALSQSTPEQEAIDVVYLPYLPLRSRAVVGEWELIPRGELADDDCLDQRAAELARGLAAMYVLPTGSSGGTGGVFARPKDGRLGEEARDLGSLGDLRRACVAMVLDPNPSPLLLQDERDLNAGHWMLTSDNAMLVAHGINREHGYTGTITGSRVQRTSLGVSVVDDPENPRTRPRAVVPPPADLRIPWFNPPTLDTEYAHATWESIRRGDDAARRLARAIDWLALAWLNTTAMTDDLRVPAFRAGFEVLLDSQDAVPLARRLTELLVDTSDIRSRTWLSVEGNQRSANLRDVGWWFVEFSILRNKLMHGRSAGQENWIHDGRSHTDLGEWYLRQAIKHTVANDGHPDILDELLWREAARDAHEWLRAHSDDAETS